MDVQELVERSPVSAQDANVIVLQGPSSNESSIPEPEDRRAIHRGSRRCASNTASARNGPSARNRGECRRNLARLTDLDHRKTAPSQLKNRFGRQSLRWPGGPPNHPAYLPRTARLRLASDDRVHPTVELNDNQRGPRRRCGREHDEPARLAAAVRGASCRHRVGR